MEGAIHALRQVGIGERGDHAADFRDGAVDAGNELVGAAGKAVEILVLVVLADAAGEVAGDGGGHDGGNAGLQVAAALVKRRFLCLQFLHGKRIVAEDIDGACHLADLVLALGINRCALQVALRKAAHPLRQRADGQDDPPACHEGADTRADSDGEDGGHCSEHHCGGRGGDSFEAFLCQRFAGIGAVDLDRVRHHLLSGQCLGKRRANRCCVARVGCCGGDHRADIVEVVVQRRADRLQLFLFGRVGGRFDLREPREHFGCPLVGFSPEVRGLLRRGCQLVGHAADGDDVDPQVHGLTGDFLLSAHGNQIPLQPVEAAAGYGGDDQGRNPHDDDKKTNLLGNA